MLYRDGDKGNSNISGEELVVLLVSHGQFSRDSPVNTTTGYVLDGRNVWGSITGRVKPFLSSRTPVYTAFCAHPASHPMDSWVFPPGVKRKRFEADISPSPNAEFKNGGVILHFSVRLRGVVLEHTKILIFI
jgi:hypothetical protein